MFRLHSHFSLCFVFQSDGYTALTTTTTTTTTAATTTTTRTKALKTGITIFNDKDIGNKRLFVIQILSGISLNALLIINACLGYTAI